MSFLPNARHVQIDPTKLTYLLTTGKVKFFILHGFDPHNPQVSETALREHQIRNQIESASQTLHGIKYTIRCLMPSPDRRNPCALTVWIVDTGQGEARFVTGYASP